MLKDLSAILGVRVEELLSGEKIEVTQDEVSNLNLKKSQKVQNKKIIGFLFAFLVMFVIGLLFIFNNYGYKKIDKDSSKVITSLNYLNFMTDTNEDLLKKMLDNNMDKVTKNDLSNDEKMFLTLNKYSLNNSGCIYYEMDYTTFKKENLIGLVFEDYAFISDYMVEGFPFVIQRNIEMIYKHGIFKAHGQAGDDRGAYFFKFDVLNAKENKDTLAIDFRVAYMLYDYQSSTFDIIPVQYYKTLDSKEPVLVREKNREGIVYPDHLSDAFTTFRFILKLDGDKTYFEEIERI